MQVYYALHNEVLGYDVTCQVGKVYNIRESYYPNLLANLMLVLKSNEKWRICIDFTNLNKACPKDSFPMLQIDQLVDAKARHELLSFIDAYSIYNQISMYEPDEKHTSFIINRGLYCYKGCHSPSKMQE